MQVRYREILAITLKISYRVNTYEMRIRSFVVETMVCTALGSAHYHQHCQYHQAIAMSTRSSVRNPTRRPTMTDVAKAAGVSQSTVSMVLNNMSGARLSEATRTKVHALAAEINVLPRREAAAAAAETSTQRNLIGYLGDELSTSPHAMQTIDGAKDAAWEHDCLVAVFATRSDPELEAAVLAACWTTPRCWA